MVFSKIAFILLKKDTKLLLNYLYIYKGKQYQFCIDIIWSLVFVDEKDALYFIIQQHI